MRADNVGVTATGTQRTLRLPGWLHDILARHLDQVVELPILPEVTARVIALCADESSDARALERVLARDRALAARVLRVANSSAYAPEEPLVSLQQAIAHVGRAAVQNAVLAVALRSRVFEVPGQQARVRAIWVHCALAAAFGREIARRTRRDVEAAFLCGLLHDVGRPLVLQATVATLAHRTKAPLPAALLETAMDEFHAELAARMVSSWKLADWTEAVVAHHHAPERAAPHDELAYVTRLADELADWAVGAPDAEFCGDPATLARLELYPADVEALVGHRARALALAEELQ